MEKYWKFTAIITVIVLSIGTFYVNSAMSKTEYSKFAIKKQSGNEEEIQELVLDGYYHEGGSMNYTNTNLKITSDGSEYRNGSSFIDQIIMQPAPMIKELQEEHRNFMRGKGQFVDSFYENEKFVAYADVKYKIGALASSDYKFAISVLNKDDGSTTSFTIKVPDSSEVEHINVEDVQMVDNELNLITHNMIRDNGKHLNEKHIYTFDLSTKKIINHETIFSILEQQSDSYVDARLIKTNPKQANENVVFLKTQSKIIQQEESERMEESSQELIAYNLKTKEKEKIDLPESLKEHQVSFFDGSTIYFTKYNEHDLVVTPFSVENKEAGNEFTIQLSNSTSNVKPPIIMVKDSKLYATTNITNLETKASITVVDVKTGETLYEGELVRKVPPKSMEEFELYIYEMAVR